VAGTLHNTKLHGAITETTVIFQKLFSVCTPGFGEVLVSVLFLWQKEKAGCQLLSDKYFYFQRGLLARTRNPFRRNNSPSLCSTFFVMFLMQNIQRA